MISRLGVSLVTLVGTAWSLRRNARLDDVVVADQAQDYLRKSRAIPGEDGGTVAFERAPESWWRNARLVD